jgi:hypothetical protein
LGTLKRNTSNLHNSPQKVSKGFNSSLAKQKYKEWKGTHNAATRFRMRKDFVIINSTNNKGMPIQITVYKPTGEEVNRKYHGGKHRFHKKGNTKKGNTKKGKKRA